MFVIRPNRHNLSHLEFDSVKLTFRMKKAEYFKKNKKNNSNRMKNSFEWILIPKC